MSTKFQPGQSGNPGGRPKAIGHVRDLAREQTEASIEALVKNLKDESGAVRNAAAAELLNRAWGKAPQTMAGEGGEGPLLTSIEVRFVEPEQRGG
jgi:HEAT repeat protein